MHQAALKIGLVAGERSGDLLGAGLLRALQELPGEKYFTGLGGEAMRAQGFQSIADMTRLSVMGLVEPLKRLPDLFALRRQLREHFVAEAVDLVVTIDSPDFNLGLARQLRKRGIRTCHYVCPSVWAWRQRRVKKIAASVDHVLCLLPFEQAFLQRHGIASTFVGHPLADSLRPAQEETGADVTNPPTLCLLPGSRSSEVSALLEPFLSAAMICREHMPGLHVVLAAATPGIAASVASALRSAQFAALEGVLELRDCSAAGQSQAAMRESTVLLLASGTATLEAALLGKPMVVAYRMSALTYALAKRLVKVEHVALPNLLLGERAVPELIQHEACGPKLAHEALRLLQDEGSRREIIARFSGLRDLLARGADGQAARQVLQLAAAGK